MTSSDLPDKMASQPMFKDLFLKQKQTLSHFFEKIDVKQCEHLLYTIMQNQGSLFVTGIGKSGFIAQKIAATMMSTGTKAFFLSPIDALHGDLGMISKNDLLLIFSKSGETEELLHLLPAIRNKGGYTYAITSGLDSRLARGTDFSLFLPCHAELCPFDLAPTTSTEIQLLLGDVLTIALMETKGITQEIFAENHPAGRIGKRASLKVRDLMIERVNTPICYEQEQLSALLATLSEKRCGCLIVINEKWQLRGIFTDGDLRRTLHTKGEKVLNEKMENLMTPSPKAIQADSLAWQALKLMESDQNHPVTVLPVLDGEEKVVVGIIKMHDLIQAGI